LPIGWYTPTASTQERGNTRQLGDDPEESLYTDAFYAESAYKRGRHPPAAQ